MKSIRKFVSNDNCEWYTKDEALARNASEDLNKFFLGLIRACEILPGNVNFGSFCAKHSVAISRILDPLTASRKIDGMRSKCQKHYAENRDEFRARNRKHYQKYKSS